MRRSTADGLTVEDLARRITRSEEFTISMLEDWRERGIAEEDNGLWRLTPDGFERYGRGILDAEMVDRAA